VVAGVPDHDLVLRATGRPDCLFEVSDVASSNDGNQKERKDLCALGVVRERPKGVVPVEEWPTGRLFLVVSEEFGKRLVTDGKRFPLKIGTMRYGPMCTSSTTRIIEVHPGVDG
jgi:hypothetical protein